MNKVAYRGLYNEYLLGTKPISEGHRKMFQRVSVETNINIWSRNVWEPRTGDRATLQVFLTAHHEMSLANLVGMLVTTD